MNVISNHTYFYTEIDFDNYLDNDFKVIDTYDQ